MSRSPTLPALLVALVGCGPATAVLGPNLGGDGVDPHDAEPPMDDATYEAEGLATALDRVIVRRFPPEPGRCAFVTFVRPGPDVPEELTLPEDWGLDAVAASDRDDCRRWGVGSEYIGAQSVRGWADWRVDEGTGLPERIGLDLVVTFSDGVAIRFVAEDLEVSY